MALREVLLDEGYDVVLATSGEEALRQIHDAAFDLILTDLRLGAVSGIDVLVASQQLWPTPVTIVLTGYASLDSAIQALDHGAYSYLTKPTNIDELKLMIRRGIERKRLGEVEMLYQLAQELASSLDPDRVFKQVIDSACRITGFPFGCLVLHEPDGPVVVGGGEDERANRDVAAYVQSLTEDTEYGTTLARGEPVVYSQESGPNVPCHALITRRGAKRFIAVPLMYLGKLEGVLYLEEARQGQAPLSATVRVIQGLGYHASIAVARARVLAKLEAVNKELKELDTTKSNLLSTVTHELKTPMVAVKGYTTLLLKQKAGPLTAKQQEYLEIALKNINRQLALIDELLSSMKIAIYRQPLRLSKTDLRGLIEDVLEIVRPEAEQKNISVSQAFDRETYVLMGDRTKLSQIFTNLLSNAVKFTPEGGAIALQGGVRSPSAVEVSISDTGIGIPENSLAKIFDTFYQVDSSMARRYGGVGLGLAITKELVTAHGGTIRVKSRLSEGASFTVRLPLRAEGRPRRDSVASARRRAARVEEGRDANG
jgi:signal transduction histidine kinase